MNTQSSTQKTVHMRRQGVVESSTSTRERLVAATFLSRICTRARAKRPFACVQALRPPGC